MKRKISILFLFFIISTIIACSANQQQNTGEYNMNTTNTISEIKLLESGLSTV